MISRYEVSLNDVSLADIDDRILITDVNYPEQRRKINSYQHGKGDGARWHNEYKENATVNVNFQIRAYAISERQDVCQKIVLWAKNGGWLTINDRPDKRLKCKCAIYPTITSVLGWTDELTIQFVAYSTPYWQDVEPVTDTITGENGSTIISVPGSISKARVEASIQALADVSQIVLSVGDTTMTLSNMQIREGQTIEISYTDERILKIMVGKTSILNKRTGDDDLLADCGENVTMGFTADAECAVTFNVRGLWE